MKAQGKYIYGIINSGHEESFGYIGISACEEVYAFPHNGISAVVSDSEIIDYGRMRRDSLAMLLFRHQKVIERIMGLNYTVIPLKLGTFAQGEGELKDILWKTYGFIKGVLEIMSDKIEIEVSAVWSDFKAVIKELGEVGEIKEARDGLLRNPKSVTVDDQMRVGFMLKKALDEKRQNYTLHIQDALKAISQGFKAHDLADDKVVANLSFLVDKGVRGGFEKRVELLNAEFGEKLNFKCVAPLPPYSFYMLEVNRMEFKDLDWARKRLGLLNDSATKDEVKTAYQRQALSAHPDKNPGSPCAEKEFSDVEKSYNILVDYSLACEQAQESTLSFNEENFKKSAIFVKVRG